MYKKIDNPVPSLDLLNKAFLEGYKAKENNFILADFNCKYITQEWVNKQNGVETDKEEPKCIACGIKTTRTNMKGQYVCIDCFH